MLEKLSNRCLEDYLVQPFVVVILELNWKEMPNITELHIEMVTEILGHKRKKKKHVGVYAVPF